MTTFWIDLLLGFWLLLFGGMAILPILTGGASSRRQQAEPAEDRVISIAPARSAPATPTGARLPLPPTGDHHERRPAA